MNQKKLVENVSPELPTSSNDAPPENDSSLEALVSDGQTLARERLREKLGREPTDREADEWLNEQTEGY